MYLWLVLATFLAVIAGYYLPLREDTHDIVEVPVAQARLVQLTAQHKLISKYLKTFVYPNTCWHQSGGSWAKTACDDPALTDEDKRYVPYQSWALEDTDSQTCDGNPYQPKCAPNSFNFNRNKDNWTHIFCYDEAGNSTTECWHSTEARKKYLVTVGPIPEKWQRPITNEEGNVIGFAPTADFMNAMYAQFKKGELGGYLTNASNACTSANTHCCAEHPCRLMSYDGAVLNDEEGSPVGRDDIQEFMGMCMYYFENGCLAYVTGI